MGRVLVISSTNTDLVCRASRLPRPGETLTGSEFATFAGGKGANQAVAAARAGASVTFCGAVGDDRFGLDRLADLRAAGIRVSDVRTVSGAPSGVALIVVDDQGENQIVIIPGANDLVTPDDATRVVVRGEHDVLSLNLEIPFETVRAAIQSNQGMAPVALNAAPYDSRLPELLDGVDLLICNEIEAGGIVGSAVTVETAGAAARRILELGCRSVAVTLGRHGAVLATGERVVHVPTPRVAVVDTTAAGDAFCGVCAAWLSAGRPLPDAVRAGVSAGTLSVTREGAQPSLPGRDEIVAMINERG